MVSPMRANLLKRKLADGRRVCGVLVDVTSEGPRRGVYAQGFQGLIVAPTGLLVAACRDFLDRVGRG